MRKILLIASIIFLSVAISGIAAAMSIQTGNFRMQTSDWSFFDDPVPPNGPVQASGNVWSVFRIDNIADANGNVTWQSGTTDGTYLTGVLGGLTLNPDAASPTGYHTAIPGLGYVTQANITAGVTHNAYFAQSATQGPAYIQVYQTTADDELIGDATDGYETGPGAGLGAAGTFGGDILTGNLWLSAVFNATALAFDEGFAAFGADGATDLYRASTLSLTTAQTTGYLDVTGGSQAATFDTNGELAGSDLKITSTIDLRDPASFNGWNGQSSGQIFGAAVPEPGTIFLLGLGLIGLAAAGRKKLSATK
jgi:PEP-CTERM motif